MSMKNFKNSKLKINKKMLFICLSLIVFTSFILFQITKSAEIKNELVTEFDKPLELNSMLTYYLNVYYEGIDKNVTSSSETSLAEVYSDYIYVEDKIPDGLTFQGFDVQEEVKRINAIPIGEGVSDLCEGYVVPNSSSTSNENNVLGLNYDESERKVSFRVKNLQAGCYIKVGIITKVPSQVDDETTPDVVELKRYFRNTAYATERGFEQIESNTTTAWIEADEVDDEFVEYNVSYEYAEGSPAGLPNYPALKHAPGETITVKEAPPKIRGYEFKGWIVKEPIGLEVRNGKFVMPERDVVFIGSFEKLNLHNVTYRIDGEMPDDYVIPNTEEYYKEEQVKVDDLKKGYISGEYEFLGWRIEGIEIDDDGYFEMPDEDVEIVGKFERRKYPVTYDFTLGVRPPNYQEILDNINSENYMYAKGERVEPFPIVQDVPGYHFQGWYEKEGFEMPNEPVVVYGEWRIKKETFSPEISKVVSEKNKKEFYRPGDLVEYEVTVKNTENYDIKNIAILENNDKAYFINEDSDKYIVETPRIAKIFNIPAKGSVIVKAVYPVDVEDKGTIINNVKIIGGEAVDKERYELTKEIIEDSEEIKVQSSLKICKNIDEKTNNNIFNFKIKGQNEGNDLDISMNIKNDGEKTCQTIHLDPGTYNISEVLTQEYSLQDIEISNNLENSDIRNGKQVNIKLGESYEITFNNKYRGKGFFRTFGSIINKIRAKENN